jgi:hypothetical protein
MEINVKSGQKETLPVLLWAVFPLAFMAIQILLEIFVPHHYLAPMHTEGGPIEALQFFITSGSVLLAGYILFKVKKPLFKLWVGAAMLGCFYIAGEEVSWGQHIFNWVTPEFWTHVNDQQETNLHNTSSWLDQKPRTLLLLGIVATGIILPGLRRWKPGWIPARFEDLYPSSLVFVTALGVIVPYLCQQVAYGVFRVNLFERVSEVQELYMYYFILLYLLDFKVRHIQMPLAKG